MDKKRLISYVRGEITSEIETTEILNWIESSPENQRSYNRLKNLWVISGLEHAENIDIPDFPYFKKQISVSKTFLKTYLKYAAVFISAFLLASLGYYFINKTPVTPDFSTFYNTVEAPNGERAQIILYDGTKVWLNSGTKLKYPVVFNDKTRDVYIEGEAYFDVAKRKEHPFVVKAGKLSIMVSGTRFNVCAYPEDKNFLTTLEEGAIHAIDTENGKQLAVKPGEQVVLNKATDRMECQKVNTELYTSWKDNLLRFESATFCELIIKMERWYDVKIIVDPSVNTKERYTMTIKTESLREMLSLISKTTKIKYEINGNNVLIKKP
jgi:transmembrane sensor